MSVYGPGSFIIAYEWHEKGYNTTGPSYQSYACGSFEQAKKEAAKVLMRFPSATLYIYKPIMKCEINAPIKMTELELS